MAWAARRNQNRGRGGQAVPASREARLRQRQGRGAGCGWERIFRRLELGKVAQEERQDGQDWDVIGIGIDDSAFRTSRTCLSLSLPITGVHAAGSRFISRIPMTETMRVVPFGDNSETVCAVAQEIMKRAGHPGLAFLTTTTTRWRRVHEYRHDCGG